MNYRTVNRGSVLSPPQSLVTCRWDFFVLQYFDKIAPHSLEASFFVVKQLGVVSPAAMTSLGHCSWSVSALCWGPGTQHSFHPGLAG